jgi:hypothetical protein
MNVSQIALYLYTTIFVFQSKKRKNGGPGMLDLAIIGTTRLRIFTLPFMVIYIKASSPSPIQELK